MTESDIKSRLCRMLRERAIQLGEFWLILRHEDSVITGLPDISISANGKTTWWEVKYGNPLFQTTGSQKLLCRKLAMTSFCRFLVFRETKDGKNRMTAIVNPIEATEYQSVGGFNYEWVIEYIRGVHKK